MKQVERGHWSNEAKEYYYAKRAAALGVRERTDNQHTPTSVSSPSQAEHAKSLGVHLNTVNRWEKDRKEIMSDPELAAPLQHQRATKKLRRSLETDVKQSREKACYKPSHLSSNRTTRYQDISYYHY